MDIVFLNSFKKDLKKVNDKKIKIQIINLIEDIEGLKYLSEINILKKLKGHPSACRISIKNYRLGIYFEDDKVYFVKLKKREDIYKLFP